MGSRIKAVAQTLAGCDLWFGSVLSVRSGGNLVETQSDLPDGDCWVTEHLRLHETRSFLSAHSYLLIYKTDLCLILSEKPRITLPPCLNTSRFNVSHV